MISSRRCPALLSIPQTAEISSSLTRCTPTLNPKFRVKKCVSTRVVVLWHFLTKWLRTVSNRCGQRTAAQSCCPGAVLLVLPTAHPDQSVVVLQVCLCVVSGGKAQKLWFAKFEFVHWNGYRASSCKQSLERISSETNLAATSWQGNFANGAANVRILLGAFFSLPGLNQLDNARNIRPEQ